MPENRWSHGVIGVMESWSHWSHRNFDSSTGRPWRMSSRYAWPVFRSQSTVMSDIFAITNKIDHHFSKFSFFDWAPGTITVLSSVESRHVMRFHDVRHVTDVTSDQLTFLYISIHRSTLFWHRSMPTTPLPISLHFCLWQYCFLNGHATTRYGYILSNLFNPLWQNIMIIMIITL